jgi:hypothetical protein
VEFVCSRGGVGRRFERVVEPRVVRAVENEGVAGSAEVGELRGLLKTFKEY